MFGAFTELYGIFLVLTFGTCCFISEFTEILYNII